MPDTPETRIGRLERSVAKLEQRVEDLLDRIAHQFDDFDTDVRSFAPLVKDVNTLQADLKYVRESLGDLKTGMSSSVSDLKTAVSSVDARLDREAKDRLKGQEARSKESRMNRTLLWVAAIGLAGTFMSSLAVVVAAVL